MDKVPEHHDYSTGLSQHSFSDIIGRLGDFSDTC